MIKKLSGNSLSSWLKVACKNYLLASEEYDKLGQYSLSSEVYERVLRLSSLIRLSEDENLDNNVEEDVDFKILDSDSVNENNVSEFGIVEKNNESGHLGYNDFSYPTIEMFVRVLRSGGRNVFTCLDNVAKDKVARYQAAIDSDLNWDLQGEVWEKKNLGYALSWYFNNNLFSPNRNIDATQVIDDIWSDRVSIDTVACFVRVEKENLKNREIWNQGRETISDFIGRIYPEFKDDKDLINYFLPSYISNILNINEIEEFDIENFKRFKFVKSRVNKPIRSDFVYGFLRFLSKFPNDDVLPILVEKINNSNNIHGFSWGDLERLVFGSSVEVSEFISKTEYFSNLQNKISGYKFRNDFNFNQYNFLSLLYPEDQALKIYSEYNNNGAWEVENYWRSQYPKVEPFQKYYVDESDLNKNPFR